MILLRDIIQRHDLIAEANRIDLELKNTPDDKDRLYIRSVIFLMQGEEIEAERLFDKITGIDDSYIQHINRAYFEVGQHLGTNPQKIHLGLHYLLKVNPDNLTKNEELATILSRTALRAYQRFDKLSKQFLEKAILLDPSLNQNDEFYYVFKVKLGNDKINAGQTFMSTFPHSHYIPDTLNILAGLTYEQGQFKKSREYYTQLANKYPETEYGKRARNRLSGWKEVIKRTIRIVPSPEPFDTGLDLVSGQGLIIQASGQTMNGRHVQGPEGGKKGLEGQDDYILPTANPMALIGKIGETGSWFFIGQFYKQEELNNGGRLYLHINEINKPTASMNDSGSYNIIVIIE